MPRQSLLRLGLWLVLLLLAPIQAKSVTPTSPPGAVPPSVSGSSVSWQNQKWDLAIDPTSGGLCRIAHTGDAMNWVHGPIKSGPTSAPTLASYPWGTIRFRGKLLSCQECKQISASEWKSVYAGDGLKVEVIRVLGNDQLRETYCFTNETTAPLEINEGDLGILAPLADEYTTAAECMKSRCNVHLWMGNSVAWINAVHMSGSSPHLGLVLNEGALASYSINPRPWTSNNRGIFMLHPEKWLLSAGGSRRISWGLFWNLGWDDFWTRALATPGVVRLNAKKYSVTAGEPLEVTLESRAPLDGASLFADGKEIPMQGKGSRRTASIPTSKPGEVRVELRRGNWSTWLLALVTQDPAAVIESRVRFIIDHQQRHAPGTPADGAFLGYDNETGKQDYRRGNNDHSAGRERMGMGVLLALYLPLCKDAVLKEKIQKSVELYDAFVIRELEDENGGVYGDAGRNNSNRLYNYPWAIHWHLAMYQATGKREHLERMNRCLNAYYPKGEKFYCIGMVIPELLKALKKEGMTQEFEAAKGFFQAHAERITSYGRNMPRSEVNYEQSICGPAVQILLETARFTGEKRFLEAAGQLLPALEAFNGQQPDYHLNDIAIRHWDDFWFGKRECYGDTFPHYWSTITAVVFEQWAAQSGGKNAADYRRRAQTILDQNLCSFFPDGTASCAYVYPLEIIQDNGTRHEGRFYDPLANDQDWALVNWLLVRGRMEEDVMTGRK